MKIKLCNKYIKKLKKIFIFNELNNYLLILIIKIYL